MALEVRDLETRMKSMVFLVFVTGSARVYQWLAPGTLLAGGGTCPPTFVSPFASNIDTTSLPFADRSPFCPCLPMHAASAALVGAPSLALRSPAMTTSEFAVWKDAAESRSAWNDTSRSAFESDSCGMYAAHTSRSLRLSVPEMRIQSWFEKVLRWRSPGVQGRYTARVHQTPRIHVRLV